MARIPEVRDQDALARFTFDTWRGMDEKYSFYVDKWRRVLDFLRDQHWKTLTEYSRDVLPDWRRFPLQNFTLAFYNDYLTDYLKSEVRFSAVPASPDPHDLDAAEIAEQVMKHLWDHLNFDRIKIDLGAWIMATGTGALRVYWDTNTGHQVPLGIPTPDGGIIPIDPATLEPSLVGEPEMVDAGEIGVEVISPQFVRWAANPAHGVMLGLLLSYEEARTFYGQDAADRLDYSDSHAGMSSDLNQIQTPGGAAIGDERTLVIEHYLPPSFDNPKGLWWTAAQNGKMSIHPAWPLPAGKIPIVSFRWIPMPGEPHIGLSPLYGLTFENKIYEEITGKILEWYQKAKPKRLLFSGGGLAPGDIDDEPFQELMVNQGAEPTSLEVDDAPAGLFQILQLTQGDMQVTSGRMFEEGDQVPEGAALGGFRTPASMKTAKAVTMAHLSGKSSWKNLGELLMHYVGMFYNEKRIVAINGPDRAFMWREFTGQDLMGPSGLAASLHVEEIPLFPQNRQNLRDTVIALLQTQAGQILFAGPDGQLDMDRISAALKATGLDVDMDVVDPDVLEARNEQVEFQNMRGDTEPPQIQPWQNHFTHHAEHTKILKSMRFRTWSNEAREAYMKHVQEHEEILNEHAQEEADAMIEQEQKLRRVREQEEVRADVMKEWAKSLIALVAETTGLEVQDVLGLVDKSFGGNSS
jgi:hypothetical protein